MKFIFVTAGLCACFVSSAYAQEICYKDGAKKVTEWVQANGKELDGWAQQMEQARKEGKDPNNIIVKYKGIDLPLSSVYIAEHRNFDVAVKPVVDGAVDETRKCAKNVALPREAWDVVRELYGLTSIFPERVTRVDFEEIRRGNITGGKDAFVPKALEDARKTVEKAGRDINREFNKALKNLGGIKL